MRKDFGSLGRWLIQLRRRSGDDQGQVLVIFTGAILSFILVMGTVIDVGILYEERRQMQNAVDAAALAAAHTARDNPSQAVAVAEQYLLLNGIDPADPSVSVTINSGYAADQVEVSVSAPIPTAFFRIINVDSKTVSVRAVGEALE